MRFVVNIASIQILRACAAWVVVIHHVHQVFFNFDVSSFVGWLAATKGAVGVDVFFVISGFVMVVSTHKKNMSPRDFLRKRLSRIVPIYWISTAIAFFLLYMFPGFNGGKNIIDIKYAVSSLLFLSSFFEGGFFPILPVGWSLNFEMFFYLLFSLSIFLERLLSKFGFLVSQLFFLWVGIITIRLYPEGAPGSEFFRNSLMLLFLLGATLAGLNARNWLPKNKFLGYGLVALGLAMICWSPSRGLLGWGIGAGLIVWGGLCFDRELAGKSFLMDWGDRSYSTYLVHLLILWPGYQIYLNFGGGGEVFQWLVIFFCLVLIGLASWQSFEQLERRLTKWAYEKMS